MLISAVCCFFLFFGNSESAMIGWQCLFCGTSIAAWNALDVITVELYPTNQRSVLPGISSRTCLDFFSQKFTCPLNLALCMANLVFLVVHAPNIS